MQTIPSRGQIQSNGKRQGQQQMQNKRYNKSITFPTFDNQTTFFNKPINTSSPDPSPLIQIHLIKMNITMKPQV